MKIFALNKGSLSLPDKWSELSYEDRIYAFGLLLQVVNKTLEPEQFRLLMLGRLTQYKPKSDLLVYSLKCLLYWLFAPIVFFFICLFVAQRKRTDIVGKWNAEFKPARRDRSVINTNLFLLSENIDFAFTIENNLIHVNYGFDKNPVPSISILGKKYIGRKFDRDIAPFTNITGKEYSDCFDLYMAYSNTDDSSTRDKCLNRIISILYPALPSYEDNLVSGHADRIALVDPSIKFGILLWFSSIVQFYTTHPVYSILYRSPNEVSGEKISLGMNSVVLMVTKEGYNSQGNIGLNDFFDSQVEVLKKHLSDALSKGVKIEDLSMKTGLTVNQIQQLT